MVLPETVTWGIPAPPPSTQQARGSRTGTFLWDVFNVAPVVYRESADGGEEGRPQNQQQVALFPKMAFSGAEGVRPGERHGWRFYQGIIEEDGRPVKEEEQQLP